jgi:Flp pilus assembly protein TadG
MRPRDQGQVTAFVATMLLALFVMAGLVIDGGYALAARRRAVDEASEAARAGAQALAVEDYRATGVLRLDPAAAVAAAQTFLVPTGHPGDVTVADDRVRVQVTVVQPTALLRMIGIGELTVTGRAEARSVRDPGSPGS